ncbi:OSJNBb0011N17.11-like protein [Zea mays]|uniref:OSJNBb0011N17.11-like protein n=1 Tax=Zea mays TaxID=4577 RepID=A0A1D6E8B2_MAIZE|nr:OSJNBb0011N17.11-like protein [Zea mays]
MDEGATTSDSSAAETFDPVPFTPEPQPTLPPSDFFFLSDETPVMR